MRRIIPFSRLFAPAAILSTLLISGGIAAFFAMGGFNLGVDFQAGMVQEVQLAPTAFTIAWEGPGNASISSNASGIFITHSGPGIETRAHSFLFSQHGTAGEIAAAMESQLEGLRARLYASGEISSQWLTRGALWDPMLGSAPHPVHYLNPGAEEIPIALVREVMEDAMGQAVVVQSMGMPSDRHFLIRVQAEDEAPAPAAPAHYEPAEEAPIGAGADEADFEALAEGGAEGEGEEALAAGEAAPWAEAPAAAAAPGRPADGIVGALEAYFGAGQVMVLRSDFVGSRFAGHLTDQIGILIAATLLLVLLYASIRFRLQYAVGAVLGIIHDGIIVVAFVVVTRMEFNTTTIAAILTILGYSTNNTIVVFDRIRENRRLYPDEAFVDIMNRSLSETLNRTVITTVTTMLAVMSLFIFTTGAMQDFALALMVGMVSGVYTTTFIVTAFMNFWEKQKAKRARRGMVPATARAPAGKPALSKA